MPPVAIAAAGAAASYGVGVAIGTITYTAASLAATVAISAALAGASMLLAPDAMDFSSLAQDRTHTIRQPVAPRQVIYGEVRTGGPIVFIQVHGDLGPGPQFLPTGVNKNKWLNLVIPLASHEVEEIGDIYFNDEKLPLGPDGYVTGGTYYETRTDNWQSGWQRGMARVRKYTGAPGQVADQALINETLHLPEEDRWDVSCIGNNVAYIVVTLEWNTKIYQSGIPNITAVVKGKKVLDPRDGQVRYSTNAALCIRDMLASPVKDGGVGATAAELNETNWIAQANLCDEAIPLADGGSEPRYTINGTVELNSSNSPKNTLEAMLTSCGGNLSYSGGKWRLLCGAYRSPTVTLTDDDFRGPVEIQTKASRRDSYNAIKGTFVSPANLWQPADYPVVMSDAFMAEDGGHRNFRELDFPFTNTASAAQRLARMDLLRSRQPITVNVQCKLTAFRCQVGDVVRVTRERQGWNAKEFEVAEWRLAVDAENGLGVDMLLRETSPEAYSWSTSVEQTVDPAPGTSLPDWRNVAEVVNLSVDSSNSQVVEGADGTLISRAMVSWDASNDALVESFEIQWRLSEDAAWPYAGSTTSEAFSIDNLPVGVSIDVRVRARNSLGIYGNFTTILNHVIGGFSARPNPSVTGLKVQGSAVGSPGVFDTRDVTFTWDPSSLGILFDRFIVEIRNTNDTVRRRVETTDPTYFYSFSDNVADTLSRSFKIAVAVRNSLGAVSPYTVLNVSNPVPALPTAVTLTGSFRTMSLRYTPPPSPDWEGIRVWRSTTTGFTPADANLVYDGGDTAVFLDAAPGTKYFVRYACFDAFGKTGLNVSAEQVVDTIRISHADLVEELIDETNLVPSLYEPIQLIPILETRIATEETTRQSAVETLSQRIDTVSAQTGSKTFRQTAAPTSGMTAGDLWFDTDDSNKVYRYSGSAWQLTEDTRISGNAAAIQTETTARINADQTLATQITTVQTEVDGNTAALQTNAASIDGLEAQYTVKIDNNGHVSGFGLASNARTGTPVSAFVVNADKFALAKPTAGLSDPVIPFIVDTSSTPPVLSFTGVISADQIQSGTIDTETLFVGGTNLVLDGPSRAIRVNNGTRDLVKLGQISSGVYGIEIRDSSGNLVLSSGSGVPAGKVSGLGSLATQSSVAANQVSGLGTLATKNSVSASSEVSGLGGLATKSTVGSSDIAAGTGVNMLYNSDLSVNTHGWSIGNNNTGVSTAVVRDIDANNTPAGGHSVSIYAGGTPLSGRVFDIFNNGPEERRYPVIPGRRYEASAYIGTFRSSGAQVGLSFFNSSGGAISGGETYGTAVNPNSGGYTSLSLYARASHFATAPAGAATVRFSVRTNCSGSGNQPTTTVTRAYLGEAGSAQTELSPWVPGVTPLSTSGVSGLGSLALKNSVSTSDVSGLGSFATRNTLAVGEVTGIGSFASLSQITSANASTYIGAAAIQSAHINLLTADKIASGVMRTDTFIQAGNNVIMSGADGGRIYITDPRTGNLRVYMGHMAGQDYGFWLWDAAGNAIFNSTAGNQAINGTFIANATVGTLKIGSDAVTVPRSASVGQVNAAGYNNLIRILSIPIAMPEGGRILGMASIGQAFPSGSRNWNIQLRIGGHVVAHRGGAAFNDAPSIAGELAVGAGSFAVEIYWGADTPCIMPGGNLVAMGAKR